MPQQPVSAVASRLPRSVRPEEESPVAQPATARILPVFIFGTARSMPLVLISKYAAAHAQNDPANTKVAGRLVAFSCVVFAHA